jgi:anaerobic selenocysteine-containing dehydrogenase
MKKWRKPSMNNQSLDNQFQMFGQMAQQSGISGAAYIDVDSASGTLRMKLKVTPAEEQAKLISAFAYVLSQVSQGFGFQVNTRGKKNEEVDNG